MSNKIYSLKAHEILDSAGNPTVEAELRLANGSAGVGSVPSGASTGSGEAFELRDADIMRYNGKGVLKAVDNINEQISQIIIGQEFESQADLDQQLIKLDGTPEKSNLGANAILAVSIAFARAVANAKNLELYETFDISRDMPWHVSTSGIPKLPAPMMVLIEGGKHADDSTDFQEFLIKPDGLKTVREQIRACQEVRIKLAEILKAQNFSTNVGLEGAFAPNGISDNAKALEFITEAIKNAGFKLKDEISIGIDVAASELFKNATYSLLTANCSFSSTEFIEYLIDLTKKYPITSIEDGLSENDQNSWPELNRQLSDQKIVSIGDDLTVTNPKLIDQFAKNGSISGVIIKMNQIGTISETIEAIKAAKENNLQIIISHRGSETTDTTLVDLAVACGADYIKVGPTRGERVCKYNR
ncbi:MAG: hypothetical protein ACD_83C00279G0002, partial [uncultured bacterium]